MHINVMLLLLRYFRFNVVIVGTLNHKGLMLLFWDRDWNFYYAALLQNRPILTPYYNGHHVNRSNILFLALFCYLLKEISLRSKLTTVVKCTWSVRVQIPAHQQFYIFSLQNGFVLIFHHNSYYQPWITVLTFHHDSYYQPW